MESLFKLCGVACVQKEDLEEGKQSAKLRREEINEIEIKEYYIKSSKELVLQKVNTDEPLIHLTRRNM